VINISAMINQINISVVD